jgi:peptidoglycan-associated lipoprotein
LAANPNRKVRLEGNCDERGSNEYNLGLGQRRADGVKKMLVLSGANSSQLDSISYGEEKPRASGHDEASWAQNRRTDINYAK